MRSAEEAVVRPPPTSLVVLPFDDLSTAGDQEYFARGMSEELINALTRVPELRVVGRTTALVAKARNLDIREIGEQLRVGGVVEGSVRKAKDRLRITVQLVAVEDGFHLWSESFERQLGDVFDLQDEIARQVVLALKVELTPEEQERFRRFPTRSLEAYDLYLRASAVAGGRTREGMAEARRMLQRAIVLDPDYAAAYALLGMVHWLEWLAQYQPDSQHLERGFELAETAVALDASLATSHHALGSLSIPMGDHERAVTETGRALALDPELPILNAGYGRFVSWAGRAEEGIPYMEKAVQLDPLNPQAHSFLGDTYRVVRRYDEAIAELTTAIRLAPDYLSPRLHLTVTYAELGRVDEARLQVDEALRIRPGLDLEQVPRVNPYKDLTEIERYLDGLRASGRF